MNPNTYTKSGSIVELWKRHIHADERKNYKDCMVFQLKAEAIGQVEKDPYFFIDHSIGQVVYMSENLPKLLPCLGEDIFGTYYENSSQRILKEHFEFVTQLSHKLAFGHLYNIAGPLRLGMHISKDFLYHHPDGSKTWMLIQSKVVDLGKEYGILLSMGKLIDIHHLRKGTHCNLFITGNGLKPEMYQFDHDADLLERHKDMSQREWEILTQLKHSNSSKNMAAHMGTSTNTVYTQRQKLLDRFGCKDITGLMQYLKQVGILTTCDV